MSDAFVHEIGALWFFPVMAVTISILAISIAIAQRIAHGILPPSKDCDDED